MGDVHVHTAPHGYEKGGYDVWYWGDTTFALLYMGLALGEATVAYAMYARQHDLGGWKGVGGGELWWGRKFTFLCTLIPVTLLRAWNLWVWGEFNGEAETGTMSPEQVDALKLQGDWLNGVCCWALLALKGAFLLTWGEVKSSAGAVRWGEIWRQLAGGLLVLLLVLGLPQALVVHYGRICEMYKSNDYCRKYRDTMSALSVAQAAAGLALGALFGRVAWQWSHSAELGGYAELSSDEQARLVPAVFGAAGHSPHSLALPLPPLGAVQLAHAAARRGAAAGDRGSYGSTGGDGSSRGSPRGEAIGGGPPGEAEHAYILMDASTYAGAAHCVFFSLLAHAAFNIYFAWYAVGGLGLLGNFPLAALSLAKLLAVEFAPFAWVAIAMFADVRGASREGHSYEMVHPGVAPAVGAGNGGGKTRRDEDDDVMAPPPADAYQIE